MTRGSWPLLGQRDLAAPLAWRDGQAVSGAQFLGEAWALAGQLLEPVDEIRREDRPLDADAGVDHDATSGSST